MKKNFSQGEEFDLHGNERAGETNFDTEARSNSEWSKKTVLSDKIVSNMK